MEEDHMTSSVSTDTGSSSVTMATDSVGVDSELDSDPRVLCNRVMVLQQNEVSALQSDSCLINRIRELERSERSLLLQLYQLASASYLPSMQHSHRLDQRLRMLRDEVRNMTQEKERGERVWRERLQRCQRQLKAKEDEMSRQCQYFENFKTQLQHKLSLARDREQTLQTRIYSLEKQLLDMTVSAATGLTTVSAVRITAGTVTHWEEQERLLSMRGEGEGEEERKEERKKQWQPSVGAERGGGQEGDEKEIQGGRAKDTKQSSNEARLEGFILSLQEDLRVLLEREEDSMTEQRRLMEQLQENQENNHFLGCKVEEMKALVQQLKLSESSLMEEVEELREENYRLQEIVGDAANQTPSQLTTVPESTCSSPGTSSPSCNPAGSSGEVHQTSDEGTGRPHPSAVSPIHHQAAAESSQNNKEDHSPAAKYETLPKNDPLNLLYHLGTKTNSSLRSLSSTTETLGEFKLGNWCSKGILNLEESPSAESDALREAYRSLGLGEDLEALQEQRDRLEVALQQTQEQLQVMAQENTEMKLQLRKEEQRAETEQGSSREKISTLHGAEDNTILTLAQDDLVQALNQENRALADRIQELLAHIELGEEEIKREETHLRERISQLEADRVKLEQENHEQGCLITELTKKTEDDLNTIMELQQMLVDSEHHMEESQTVVTGTDYKSEISGRFHHNNLDECVDSLVESVLKEKKTQLVSSQRADDLTAASAPGSQHDNHYNIFHNSPQNNLDVSSLNDQVGQLTKSVRSLRSEQDELTGSISCLREQQREIALSVQTQTEVKQQLTRTVWGLKEEKDNVSQSLAGLKQEREQLTRTVCGLKDERDQFIRSLSGLREEKEQLSESLSSLRSENDKLIESLSSGKEESDLIIQSLQSLQTDSDQLSQTVLCLKQERDELTSILKCLRKERDEEQSSCTVQEDRDKLIKAVSSLREEKEKVEHSLACLRQEEEQIKLTLQALREERNKLQIALPSQIQTEGRNQRQHLLNPNRIVTTKKTETVVRTGECNPQQYQTDDERGHPKQGFDGKEEQSDLMTEIEALGAELKRSRDELEESRVDTERLRGELRQSESRREEAERRAAQAADSAMRLTDVADQMEETKRENDSLIIQVKELQSKLRDLVREKSDALSLKGQIEEQHNVLTVQLKAKTVALEELNSEYMALKRGQGGKDDLSAVLISLRARYDDIRAKYDALLKKKSQKDLDVAPLKAKLSCLVVKCQERNSLLLQMMKAMRRQGSVDITLAQQVEQLLSDSALQDYTAAFAPGTNIKTWDYSTGFTPGFISQFHNYTTGFTPDQASSPTPSPVNQQYQNGLASEPEGKCRELKTQQHASLVASESTITQQVCSSEVTPAPTGTPKKNTNTPAPASPVQHHVSVPATPSPVVPALPESSNTAQLSTSAKGAVQAEKIGFHHPDIKGKSSPDPSSSTRPSLSRTPPSPRTRVNLSRRLSSPEKIINLHEQLQKTLKSSYQAPESRGRGPQPRRSLSLLTLQTDLGSASQTKQQILSLNVPQTNSLPLTAAASPAKQTPATLFNAVASRSANVTFSPNMFTQTKPVTSKMSTSAPSFEFSVGKLAPSQSKSSSSANTTVSPKATKKITATLDVSDAKRTASPDSPLKTTTFDSDVLVRSDTNPKTTASETTAPSISTAPEADHLNTPSEADGAAPGCEGLVFDAQRSAKRSNQSARKFPAALENTKTARHQPGAPAGVRSVEVIKTVGQSSLMIGWERPPLDELGCSNGTFVYGYRVFVDGDFHKSVMSSACTKCVLENVDLSLPVHISVQTLGSNGLGSNSAHTTYRTSVTADHH